MAPQVSMSLPEHPVVFGEHATQAPPKHTGVEPPQAVEDASYTHPCPSAAQLTAVLPLHRLVTLVHVGSVVHVHCPKPAAPVQIWCVPQATGALYDQQPVAALKVHVESPPVTHDVCPD